MSLAVGYGQSPWPTAVKKLACLGAVWARVAATVPQDATLIVDTTASLQVLAAETRSAALNQSPARLARVAMYGHGPASALGRPLCSK